MQLLTTEIKQALAKYPLYSQDGKGGQAVIVCKFFLPGTAWTWYVLEGNEIEIDEDTAKQMGITPGKTWQFFGITCNQDKPEGEYGYFTLAELEAITLQVPVIIWDNEILDYVPQKVERERYYTPKTIAEVEGLAYYDKDKDEPEA